MSLRGGKRRGANCVRLVFGDEEKSVLGHSTGETLFNLVALLRLLEYHVGAVRELFEALVRPVYAQIGNHDYLTNEDRSGYESVFPNRLNYWFEHQGWQFVGFDSTQGTKYENTEIQPTAMDWLGKTAPKLSRTMPTVIFTHFPLGAGVKYRPGNADNALDHFRGHDLRGVFNGHYHGYTEREWNLAPVVTNKCCALKRGNHDGTKEKGYFVCTVKEGSLSREFVQVGP